jgi:hypothetical protein
MNLLICGVWRCTCKEYARLRIQLGSLSPAATAGQHVQARGQLRQLTALPVALMVTNGAGGGYHY